MSLRERQLIAIITLLEEEIQCLRSVLSEFETDKSHFVQFNRAETIAEARMVLEHWK